MAARPRNRAGMDAEAVARLMAAQDAENETAALETAPVPQPAEPVETLPPTIELEVSPELALPPAETTPEPQWAAETSIMPEPEAVTVSPDEPGAPAEAGETELPEFDPGKMDGRSLRRTGREPFATRIKPEAHATLKRLAAAHNKTMAEVLELAVAAYERRLKPAGRKPAA